MLGVRRSVAAGAVVLIALVAVLAAGLIAEEPAKSVRVIYTNDLMGAIEPCG